jgi:uncharacterized protein YgiM (DUF1202 family)
MLGPSYSNYAVAGSIDEGEYVYVLGKVKNTNWYHIQYQITSGQYVGKQKIGYVPGNNLTIISGGYPADEIYNGGQRTSNSNQTVWSCDDSDLSIITGSVYANEGVTELYAYQYSDNDSSYYVSYIEYSSSLGTKRGYLYSPNLSTTVLAEVSSVARVSSDATLYYGSPYTSYAIIGAVDTNEFVTILAKTYNTVYVEYNTTAGRKRGYVSVDYLDLHTTGLYYRDLYADRTYTYTVPNMTIFEGTVLYAGPSTQYVQLATLSTDVSGKEWAIAGNGWSYVEYTPPGGTQKVSGWRYV